MEERLNKIEENIELLKHGKGNTVYVLSQYDNYAETYELLNCYNRVKDVYDAALEIVEYIDLDDILNLESGKSIETEYCNDRIRIHKYDCK